MSAQASGFKIIVPMDLVWPWQFAEVLVSDNRHRDMFDKAFDERTQNKAKQVLRKYIFEQCPNLSKTKVLDSIKMDAEMVAQIADGIVNTYDWLCDKGSMPLSKTHLQIAHFVSKCSQTIRNNTTTDKQRARLREQLHSLNIIFDDGAMLAFEQAFESNMNNDWGNEADIFPSQDGNAPFGN
jgi:hypothetical protein